jgi:hypothetical protein
MSSQAQTAGTDRGRELGKVRVRVPEVVAV